MLHILLLIFKIIGIVIAALAGLLLLAVLIALFVPIRYRFEGKKYSDIVVRGKVTWLFGLVHLRVLYLQDKLNIVLKIVGYRFYDSNAPDRKRHKKKRHRTKEESLENDLSNLKKESKEEEQARDTIKEAEVPSNQEEQSELLVDKTVDLKQSFQETGDKKVEDGLSEDDLESKAKSEDKIDGVSNLREEYNKISLNQYPMDKREEENAFDATQKDKKGKEEKNSFLRRFITKVKEVCGKITNIFISIGNKIKNLTNVFHKLKEKLLSIKKLIVTFWEKKRKAASFFQQIENKAAIKLALSSLWKLLKHVGPVKIKGYVHFGTGDPATTGQVLGAAAAFYGYYGKYVKVKPDFEEEVLEGELFIKGRIRLFNLLIIGIKLLRDENFKRFIKNTKLLKEELL